MLFIPEPGNISRLSHDTVHERLSHGTGKIQKHGLERLLQGITDRKIKSLIGGVVLGVHLDAWKETAAPFRRIGVAHLLAISGMHLGIIVVFAYVAVHMLRGPPLVQAVTSLLFLITYILLVQWRAPIQRAAFMLGIYSLFWLVQRRCRTTGLLLLAGVGSITHEPGELFQAGFQLSYLVVFALVTWGRTLEKRWSPMRPGRNSPRRFLAARLLSVFTISVLAWMTATPIVLHHFGVLSPLGPALSVILLVPTMIIVILGFFRIILPPIFPPVDDVLRLLLELTAGGMVSLSEFVDSIPWSSFEVNRTSTGMTCMLLVAVALWARFGLRQLYWSCRRLRQRSQFIQGL